VAHAVFNRSEINSIIEEVEGEESEDLLKFIGSRSDYIPFLNPIRDSNPTRSTRLYLMTSVSGDFQVKTILYY